MIGTGVIYFAQFANTVAGATEITYLKTITQERGNQKRIIIISGSNKAQEQYGDADGKPHRVLFGTCNSDELEEVQIAATQAEYNAMVNYYRVKYNLTRIPTGLRRASYETEYIYDKQHKGNGDLFYLWKAPDGTTMASPITYPDDSYAFIKREKGNEDRVEISLRDYYPSCWNQPELNEVWNLLNQADEDKKKLELNWS